MHTGNLHELLIFLIAAIITVAFFKRLQLSPVLGYLVAGGIIGPHGLAFIQDLKTAHFIGEFGVVFLLFYIGLEMTFERLKSMRTHVFGFGSLQMLISGLLIGSTAHMLGVNATGSVIIGWALALSSTALILQVLAERGEQASQVGRLSLAALILQDLAVVPLLIMVPLLGNNEGNLMEVVVDAAITGTVALVLIFFAGRLLLQPVLRAISSVGSQELFTATTLLIVLGASYITAANDLSLALGAFVAGLLVGETEYRLQVEADIKPFKGLLLGLFFMTVGMSINFQILLNKLPLILLLTTSLMVGKWLVVFGLARVFGFRMANAASAGLYLCQGGEFAFAVFVLAANSGVLSEPLAQTLFITVSISMAITPLFISLGQRIIHRSVEKNADVKLDEEDIESQTHDLDGHIIVIGYGRVGQTVCKLLTAENINNFVAIDSDPKIVKSARKEGKNTFFGHAERVDVLRSLGIDRSQMVVITIRDPKDALKTVKAIAKAYPALPIIARAWDRKHAYILRDAGAMVVIAEAFESSLALGGAILRSFGTAEHEVERVIDQFRHEEYPPREYDKFIHHYQEDSTTKKMV